MSNFDNKENNDQNNNELNETNSIYHYGTEEMRANDNRYYSEQQSNLYYRQGNGGDPMNEIDTKKKKSGKGNKFARVAAYAAIFGLVSGTVFQGVNYGADYLFGNVGKQNVQLQTTDKTIGNGTAMNTGGTVTEVANNVMPSTVAITSTIESIQYGFFNQEYKTQGTGSGSGIIIGKNSDNLLIATNNHVIDGATKVQVTFYHDPKTEESGEVVEATIRGTDVDSDLAVVEVPLKNISADTMSKIKVAVMGDSEKVSIGQQVVAIGNALGYGQSVTGGYVSALNRKVQLEDKTMTLMQTDAAINPGNSGGALLNMNGEVIGINSAKYTNNGVEGMGYAIPMAIAKPILEDIMNQVSVPKGKQAYLGITGQTVTEEYMKNFNMPAGVFVGTVTEKSPAEKAGMFANDIIVKFNDREVSTMEGLQSLLSRKAEGDKVTITVKRLNGNGEYTEQNLNITLGKKTESILNQQNQQEKQNNSDYNSRNGDDFWSFFN